MVQIKSLVLVGLVAQQASAGFTGGAAKKVQKKVVKKSAPKRVAPKKSSGGFSPTTDIGVTPPLGLFDPLGFLSRGPEVYRRYQEIEIKHGRLAMAATLGVITTEAGIRFPGYLSISQDMCAQAHSAQPLHTWVGGEHARGGSAAALQVGGGRGARGSRSRSRVMPYRAERRQPRPHAAPHAGGDRVGGRATLLSRGCSPVRLHPCATVIRLF